MKRQAENGRRGSLPVIVGRSLPRAMAAGTTSRPDGRAPPFETAAATSADATEAAGAAAGGGKTQQYDAKQNNNSNSSKRRRNTNKSSSSPGRERTGSSSLPFGEGGGGGGVGMENIIAGNPGRAMEELNMRARLETVREEIDGVLKMHASMAKGERTSWLKKVERQNEENSYQVPLKKRLLRMHKIWHYTVRVEWKTVRVKWCTLGVQVSSLVVYATTLKDS